MSQSPSRAVGSGNPLTGTWRLVSIQIVGPNGRTNDPFYNANPSGMLIYGSSGWMSVQIESHPRPPMNAPASRSGRGHSPEDARLECAVLDTYYAYTGTWAYDSATSTVTHRVEMSLIPGEAGKAYTQSVRRDRDRLVFTVSRDDLGTAMVQEKVWTRVTDATEPRGASTLR